MLFLLLEYEFMGMMRLTNLIAPPQTPALATGALASEKFWSFDGASPAPTGKDLFATIVVLLSRTFFVSQPSRQPISTCRGRLASDVAFVSNWTGCALLSFNGRKALWSRLHARSVANEKWPFRSTMSLSVMSSKRKGWYLRSQLVRFYNEICKWCSQTFLDLQIYLLNLLTKAHRSFYGAEFLS